MQQTLQRKLLIVEDDDITYNSMEFAFTVLFRMNNVAVALERAVTLLEATYKLHSFEPHVVSVDMEFPLENKFGRCDEKAGATFVSHLKSRHLPTGCIVYSGTDKETVEKRLCDAAVKEFPPSVPKSSVIGGGPMLLAQVVTGMLLRC